AVSYCQDNGQLFFNEEYSWTGHTKTVETGRFWPNNRTLVFCADALQEVKTFTGITATATPPVRFDPTYTITNGTVKGKFKYTSPCSGKQGENWYDALVQPDPIVAIKPKQVKQETTVPLKFHHPLAAIRIKVGTVPENILVRDTYLKRIIQTGDCEFVASGTDDNITFTWSNQMETDTVTYIQSNWKQVAKNSTGTEIHNGSTSFDDCTFFVVPQTLRGDAEIGFDYHVAPERNQEQSATSPADTGDNHYRIFKAFKAFGVDKLEADTRYTFTLSLAGSMGITITDACSNGVKNNVVITNTGRSTGYVRAAIVGWWKNNSNNIVAPWNDLPGETCTYGKYELPTNWNTYWKKGGDGFFYYHKTVLPGKKLEGDRALFTSYTLTGSAPVTGALLEIDIVAQIIRIDANLTACDWHFPTWQ
ncbi:MAG: fimbrillin family protein, partial [Bacteroidales bacterium]|nr:fimbrillin family protein [Bacteroidales bacterium]